MKEQSHVMVMFVGGDGQLADVRRLLSILHINKYCLFFPKSMTTSCQYIKFKRINVIKVKKYNLKTVPWKDKSEIDFEQK